MSQDGLPPLRDVIQDHDLSAKKAFSQNFILDLNLTGRIARSAGPVDGAAVVEIGPGPGGLTRGLLANGAERVVAIEKDPRCLPALEQIAAHYPGRLTVILDDATEFDPARLPPGRKIIVGNLPYAVATNLLVGWLCSEPWPPWYESMTLMFQREVAERIVAVPGSKVYGRLSVLAQWRTHAHGDNGDQVADLPLTRKDGPAKLMVVRKLHLSPSVPEYCGVSPLKGVSPMKEMISTSDGVRPGGGPRTIVVRATHWPLSR